MYTVKPTSKFQRDIKRAERRGYNISLLTNVIKILAAGDYIGFRECHITPDWLLVYRIDRDQLILVLTRTGTHSDLF